MAEMTASEAIEILHNNQYQKHIGNGEYDYIHPLTDAEAKGVERLILAQRKQIIGLQEKTEQQAQEIAKKDRMLEVACEQLQDYADEYTGGTAEQWRKWLEKEAEGDGQ